MSTISNLGSGRISPVEYDIYSMLKLHPDFENYQHRKTAIESKRDQIVGESRLLDRYTSFLIKATKSLGMEENPLLTDTVLLYSAW